MKNFNSFMWLRGYGLKRVGRILACLTLLLTLACGNVWGTDITVTPYAPTNITSIPYGLFTLSHSSTASSSKISSGAITTGSNGDVITIHFETTKSDIYIKSITFNSLSNGTLSSSDGTISSSTFTASSSKNAVDIVLTSGASVKGTVKITNVVIDPGTNDIETITFTGFSSPNVTFSSSAGTSALTSITKTSGSNPSVSSNILTWPNSAVLTFSSSRKITYIALQRDDGKNDSFTSSPTGMSDFAWSGNSNTVAITNSAGGGRPFAKAYVIIAPACTSISPSLNYTSKSLMVGDNSSSPTLSGNTGSGAVTWTSSNTDVATVNSSGVVTAEGAGSATITASIAANGGYCEGSATADFTVTADPLGSHTITYTLSPINTADASLTSTQTSTSTYLKNLTTINASLCGFAGSPSKAGNRTAKINRASSGKDDDKYIYFTFEVEDGYQFTPTAITIKVANVSDVTTFDASLISSDGPSVGATGQSFASTNGTVETWTITNPGSTALTGTVTLKIWPYAASAGSFRFGTPITIDGTVAAAVAPSCTAPNHVDISGDWDKFGGETISLTATAYSSAGTGSPIADGNITGWQWQKLVGSTWTNVTNGTADGVTTSGATTKNLQISNCGQGNSGKYRCVVSTGATCSTASATATDGSEGYVVKVYALECYTGGTTVYNFTRDGNNQRGSVSIALTASTGYAFKIHADKYYGNDGTINFDENNWTFTAAGNNVTVNSGLGGTFTFTIDYSSNGDVPVLAVTYPRKRIYLSPGVWDADGAKFAYYYFHKTGDDTDAEGWTDFLTNDDCGMYADIPQWNEVKIIPCRLKNTTVSPGSWDDRWNQTNDITVNSNDYVTITGWEASDFTYTTYAVPTFTVTTAVSPAGYGTVSAASVSSVACGTSISASTSTLTVGATTVTASPADATAEYTYAFDSWSWSPSGATVTSAVTATANFTRTPNSYTLTWNLGGGTVSTAGTGAAKDATGTPSSSVAFGTALTAPTVTKTGYNFNGWDSDVAATMPAANTTYTATWTAKTTAITLEAGEGGTDGSATATYGTSTITDYVPATRTGYTLGNYYKDDGDHNILTKEGNLNTGNKGSLIVDSKWASEDAAVTLYAQWSATSYTLSYDLAGGSVASPNPTSYTIESSAITLNNPTKTGYTFAGWTGTGLAEATTTVTIAAGSTGNRSYTATWTAIVPSSVSLNKSSTTITEGGTETLTATISPAVVADNTITWSTSDADVATVDGGVVTAVATGTATITATTHNSKSASCEVTVAAAVTYTVTYNYNGATGGASPSSETVSSTTLPSPTKTGYTFDGWYTTAGTEVGDGGDTYNPTADITLYARWTETCSGGGGGDPVVIKLFDGSTDDDFAASPITVSGVSLAYTAYDKPADATDVSSKTNNVNSKNYAKGYQFSTSEINKGANRKCLSFTVPSGYTATFTHAFGATGNSRVIRLGSSLVTTDEDENYIATLVTVPSSGGSGGIWGGTYSSSLSAGTYFITGTGGGWQIVELIFTLTPTGSSSACNKVLYHGNGAESGYIYDPTVYDDGDDPVVLGNTTGTNGVAFVKDGYTFQGWATSAGGSVAYSAGDEIENIDDDVDLYAVWEEDVCTPVVAPTALTCSAHTSSSLTFTWTKASNASGYTATLYSDSGCESEVTHQDLGDVATVTFSTLSASTTYYCKVQSHGDGSTYCADGGTTAAQSGTTDAACTAHGLAYGTAAVAKNEGDAAFTNTLTNPNSLSVSYSSSVTSVATVNATSGMVTIEGAGSTVITATWAGDATYCAGTATYTLTVSNDCTPQSLVKTQLTSVNAGTTTGYNDGQYAGDPVIATFEDTKVDGGYKLKSNSKLFVTLKGGFVEGDKINIVVTQASDLTNVGKLLIFYDASTPKLLTTIDAASAGKYTYTLTAANITTLGSTKTIGVYRPSSGDQVSNPLVKSVEVEGCREWAVCTAPDAVAAGSVTGEGATFTITDAENTNNYEIYYSTSSTAPTAETSATISGISTKSRAVTGLTAVTTYYYWVRSNCGGVTKSSWVAGTPASFTTEAAAATHSVTYNGNGSTGGSVPTDATAYEEGDVVTVKGNTGSLVKTSQTFLGWSTNSTPSSGTFYPAGYKFAMPDAAVTLYAVWGSASEEKYYYGSISITTGALTPGSTGGHKGFFTNDGGVIATSSAISLSSTPSETGFYYESSTLTHTELSKSSNWNTSSSSKRTIRAFKFANNTSYTLALGSATATKITFYGKCGSASRILSVGGVEWTSNSTKETFEYHEFTKVGNFTGDVTIGSIDASSDNRGDFYGILVVTVSGGAGSNHTVTFNMNGKGSAIEPITDVPDGSKIGAPVPSPTAVGAEFGGWYNEAGCTSAWDFATGTITDDKTLFAKWTTCAPTISGHPTPATYTQYAAATALSVTAIGEGLNYQWYTSEDGSADIQGSSAIPGATSASYTPSTSLLGTIYYFCVVSNTCGNAVSNKAAITVNDGRPTPTANWTIDEPEEGGKGFTFSIEVNKNDGTTNWDGELIASMLTLSDNAILDGASIVVNNTNKTISGTYGVKAGSSSPVTFYLLLPATTSQSATRLDHDRTFTPCAGGGVGDSYNVPVRKDYEKDASNNYRWVTPGAGEITYAVSSSISSVKAASTVASVFDSIMSGDKQYVWVKTYEANTKTIRLHVETSGANISVNALYKNTVYATAADKDIVSSDDYSVSYDGSGSAENTGAKGTHYMDITFDSPLNANDIICIKFSSSKVRAYGAILTTEGDGGDQTTGLTWSNTMPSGDRITRREDASDFAFTAVRDATAEKSLGLISYTSSNTTIATVNASTGQVHIADNIDFGGADYVETTITASLAASGCYKGKTINYILRVEKYACTDKPGTIEVTYSGCEWWFLEVSGYEEGASIQWYRDGDVIGGATNYQYTAAIAGEYHVVTTKNCAITSTNSINVSFTAATAEKIVDQWYVKNGRRTPDIALVQTTGATSFTVTSGGTITEIGGCTFELKDDGIIYLHGQKEDGSAPSDMTAGDMPITITVSGCTGALSGLDITIHKQAETPKPSVAFVVDGTLRKDGGSATSVLPAKTSDRPLWTYLSSSYALTGCNVYWSVDSKELREYYSQFDAILITDDPSTDTKGTGGVSYVKAFGTMVDVRPVLTMEAYVGKFKDGGWHVYNADPTSPNPRQVEMKLECKNHDIFKGLDPNASDNVRTTTDEHGNEYWHVIMVDTTVAPYHNTSKDYKALPALQGFDPHKFDHMLGVGTIAEGTLQGGVERQEEPAARMMILGIQNEAMAALTNEGKLIIKNAIEYLLKTNMEDVNDCSNYFTGGPDGTGANWATPENWSRGRVPDFESRVRILRPVVISDDTKAIVARVDIATRGTSKWVDGECNGSVTVNPRGALIVSGKIRRAEAPRFGIDDLMPTENDDLTIKANDEAQGALILDNEDGETNATVEMYSASHWEVVDGKKKKYWSYVALPVQSGNVGEYFYNGFSYLYDETVGWIKKGMYAELHAFEGLGISMQSGNMEYFHGALAPTTIQEITLTKTLDAGNGENLIGNSWTAPIQIANFDASDFGSATATVYVYNTGRDDENEEDPYGGSGSTTAGQWISVPISSAKEGGYTGLKVIPAMNAFQVNTSSETTLTLDYDKLVRGGATSAAVGDLTVPLRAPKRSPAKAQNGIEAMMCVRMSGEKTHADVWLQQDERFSNSFDNGWEATYVECDNRSPQFYAQSEIGKMAFLALPDLEGTVLGLAPSRDGNEYSFTFHYVGEEEFYLNDLKLHDAVLINEENSYEFTYSEGDTNRFYISRTAINAPTVTTGVGNTRDGLKAQKILYNNKLYIIINGRVYSAEGALVK